MGLQPWDGSRSSHQQGAGLDILTPPAMSGSKRSTLSFSMESILSQPKRRKDEIEACAQATDDKESETRGSEDDSDATPDSTSQTNTPMKETLEVDEEEATVPDSTSPEKTTVIAPVAEARSGEVTVSGVQVTLLERGLWEKFSKLGTEMIITKAGR